MARRILRELEPVLALIAAGAALAFGAVIAAEVAFRLLALAVC